MRWNIHDDGSFDLATPHGSLIDCWPGIDHQPVHARQVEVHRQPDGAEIIYHLAHGSVRLVLSGSAGRLSVACSLLGRDQAPYWIHPIHHARLERFRRLFRQGVGFSGPSGFVDLDLATTPPGGNSASQPWSWDSYLLSGFVGSSGTVVIAPHQHADWQFQATVFNRTVRNNFRNRELAENLALCELGFRTERVSIPGRLDLPTLHVSAGVDAFATLRGCAGNLAAANHVTRRFAPAYHYCTWYWKSEHYGLSDLRQLLTGLKTSDPHGHLQAVQIDDGPATAQGDWLTPKDNLWPGGLAQAFSEIAASGRVPGIWVGPFMVASASRLAADHPDWLLHWTDGSLIRYWKKYDGTSPSWEHFVLDTSHPEALAWIRTVFRVLRGWGARFFKTDFLEWGLIDSTRVRRYTPGRSGTQYYTEALRAIREEIGPDSHWLGCIAHFAPGIGLHDSMRVASDVGLSWNGPGGTGNDGTGGGTQNMIEEMFATQYFNEVLWQNDPDVLYLRDCYIEHDQRAIEALACWHGILGGSVNTSDPFELLPPERLAWWHFLRPAAQPAIARLPYFESGHRFRVAVRHYPAHDAWAVLLLNDRTEAGTGICRLADLVGRERSVCYRWGPGLAEPLGELDRVVAEIPAHGHQLLYVSATGTPPPAGLTLGGA